MIHKYLLKFSRIAFKSTQQVYIEYHLSAQCQVDKDVSTSHTTNQPSRLVQASLASRWPEDQTPCFCIFQG